MTIKILTTVQYDYACSSCGNKYSENRTTEESQYFTKCHTCGNDFLLEKETEILVEEFPCPVEEGKTFVWSPGAKTWIEIKNDEGNSN